MAKIIKFRDLSGWLKLAAIGSWIMTTIFTYSIIFG